MREIVDVLDVRAVISRRLSEVGSHKSGVVCPADEISDQEAIRNNIIATWDESEEEDHDDVLCYVLQGSQRPHLVPGEFFPEGCPVQAFYGGFFVR